MTDFLLVQQLHRMMGQLPRPRLMFRKGIGMRGYFKPYRSFEEYTSAEIFCKADEGDEPFAVRARFSALLGDEGTADTRRNIKGFAVRFHAGAGEYDLVCSSLPVFFISRSRDFPALADALHRKVWFDGIEPRKFWEFTVNHPEALSCVLRLFSRAGISASYREITWYSIHTCVWSSRKGKRFLVRYRWKPVESSRSAFLERRGEDRVMAEFLAGSDPDVAEEDLQSAVVSGDFPTFELWVQIADFRYSSHPEYQKQTVMWNEAMFPPVPVGILKLTELEERRESDEICFSPGNLGPGIALRDDEFSAFMEYAHNAGGAERGAWV